MGDIGVWGVGHRYWIGDSMDGVGDSGTGWGVLGGGGGPLGWGRRDNWGGRDGGGHWGGGRCKWERGCKGDIGMGQGTSRLGTAGMEEGTLGGDRGR